MSAFVLGSSRRRLVREKMLSRHYARSLRKKAKRIGDGLYCGGKIDVYCNRVEIGNYACLNGASFLGRGQIRIGDNLRAGGGLVILTENHNYEGETIPYDKTYIVKDVEIGDCVWIGYGVTILPGTSIGEGAIIQAGSVVHGQIPPYAIAGGNPAKVFAYRNQQHYEELASLGRFHRHY